MKSLFFALGVTFLFLFQSCTPDNVVYHYEKGYHFIEGQTMGTTYHIKYEAPENKKYIKSVQKLLKEVNQSLSTYIENSTISRINMASESASTDYHFDQVFDKSKELYKMSGGAFDPTVMPLVNAWGFGFEKKDDVTPSLIDSLLPLIGFDKVKYKNEEIIKDMPDIMLDFSAIAKGYGVDVLAEMLEEKGVKNYMVEIGGELRVKGHNPSQQDWQIGIEKPMEGKRELKSTIGLNNHAVATSGNYRNFYYKDGKRYAHTINPQTGYPVSHNLLSTTVIAKDCITADAYATAFMVLGLEESIKLSNQVPGILVYFIYEDENRQINTYISNVLTEKIKEVSK